MIQVTIWFHENLDFFISRSYEKRSLTTTFHVTRSVKDLIESIGVPHVEVDRILVNDFPVGFDYLLKNGDFVRVFPPVTPIETESPGFIADVHLKTLTRNLRMLGFDTLYDRSWDDDELAKLSEREKRVLLSRDTRLLMRNNVTRGMYIRSIQPHRQVIEVINRYSLLDRINPFKRCITCNGKIVPAKRETASPEHIPAGVLARADSLFRCSSCGKYYWNGTHVEKMMKRIEEIRREVAG